MVSFPRLSNEFAGRRLCFWFPELKSQFNERPGSVKFGSQIALFVRVINRDPDSFDQLKITSERAGETFFT